MSIELQITNKDMIYKPIVCGEITYTTTKQNTPSTLTFTIYKDDVIDFVEGNPIKLMINDNNIFYGFIFKKSRTNDGFIKVTAYDQLRYLKNKDTRVYSNITATTLISNICNEFQLNQGFLENTRYIIPERIEDGSTLFDIIQTALNLTFDNTGQLYVLYDDFGKLTLKNIGSMIVPLLIDKETASSFDYVSSIDSNTYNKIKLLYKDDNGYRDVHVVKNDETIENWGVLQYYDTLSDGENKQVKGEILLSLYNKKTRTLSIKKALGDTRVRAGCMIVVKLNLGDIITNNLMIVESCKHSFTEYLHTMDLTLSGGEFIA